MKFACAILAVAVTAQDLDAAQQLACDTYKSIVPDDTTSDAYKAACEPTVDLGDLKEEEEEDVKNTLKEESALSGDQTSGSSGIVSNTGKSPQGESGTKFLGVDDGTLANPI